MCIGRHGQGHHHCFSARQKHFQQWRIFPTFKLIFFLIEESVFKSVPTVPTCLLLLNEGNFQKILFLRNVESALVPTIQMSFGKNQRRNFGGKDTWHHLSASRGTTTPVNHQSIPPPLEIPLSPHLSSLLPHHFVLLMA